MTDTVVVNDRSESREMLNALYNYTATYAKTLSFQKNDMFILHHTTTKQRNWWQVINAKGQIGYVPSNYVTAIQVSYQCWVKFIDGCVAALNEEGARPDGCLVTDRQELLLRLVERRNQGDTHFSGSSKRLAPCPPDCAPHTSPVPSASYATARASSQDISMCRQNVESSKHSEHKTAKHVVQSTHSESRHPTSGQQQDSKKAVSSPLLKERVALDPNKDLDPSKSCSAVCKASSDEDSSERAYQLVEKVRMHTQLSHEMSRVAVMVVISILRDSLPSEMSAHLDSLFMQVQGPLVTPKVIIEKTHDARRLQVIFNELRFCKEDSQQRSWMLHEDEATIIEFIKELTSILANADAIISRHVMSKEQYVSISSLVQYYQMEVRWSIRQLLLQAFGVMCSLDATVVTLLLNSILPSELARDMRSNHRNIPKLKYTALLLTMIFSMGEAMPVTHLDHLGAEFVTFLLKLIETPPDTDIEEQIPDLFLNLVISYNLQFTVFADNMLLKALMRMSVAKTFTEKILVLFNREEDPVRVFEHQPAPPHSVLKLFVDLFSSESTASLFYTNDTMVLIDIIVRQLADLSPGDKKRQQYLRLCQLVMRSTPYAEHHHRQDDLSKTFTRIFCEESELSRSDQQLVRDISNEFPQYFKS